MKKFIENLSDAAIKVICASTAVGVTIFTYAFARDVGEFYAHYFAGVMSAVALFMIFDEDE